MDFDKRFKKLNEKQREAVRQIAGPLLVLAGPGTGKTELLSMRAAQILRTTDTLPASILCLTYTDAGAMAMRKRLTEIIGSDAYKVAIQTFHSFGSEVINQNPDYFYNGADAKPIDKVTRYDVISDIFDGLDHSNPLSKSADGEYIELNRTITAISDIKKSGLSSGELLVILNDNERIMDAVETDLRDAFGDRVNNNTANELAPITQKVAALPEIILPPAITPYQNTLALSLAHAIDAANEEGSTKPITAWKNKWLEKNDRKELVFKDRKRDRKLRAIADVYDAYVSHMLANQLYDYDDMILQVIHALELHPDLAANLREKYLYIMVDEFQDTNLAQLRILFSLTEGVEKPNIMAVGDDDQGIFSFQGADISNIHRFRKRYDNPPIVVLTENYRSTTPILELARSVITESNDRLEVTISDLTKKLKAHRTETTPVSITSYISSDSEYFHLAEKVKKLLDNKQKASEIAIIARRHNEIVALDKYLAHAGITTNYEKRHNALENVAVILIESILRVVMAISKGEHGDADALLPEIISAEPFQYPAIEIWKLSLQAAREHKGWLEIMSEQAIFQPFALWLIDLAAKSRVLQVENIIDQILGVDDPEVKSYTSPIYDYYFSRQAAAQNASDYLTAIESLRAIRDTFREYVDKDQLGIETFLDLLASYRAIDEPIIISANRAATNDSAVNLLTAHGSKGLEFDHVFVVGMDDNNWGLHVSSGNNAPLYPANLEIGRVATTYDERIRLAYVALTRARVSLSISCAATAASGKERQIASFLAETADITAADGDDIETLTEIAKISWQNYLTTPITPTMKELLAPRLESYQLAATHLGNFIDLLHHGPEDFLLNNLLNFPSAKSLTAKYGTAIHRTLEKAHNYIRIHHASQPIEDIIGSFETILGEQELDKTDFDSLLTRGIAALNSFFTSKYADFEPSQLSELNFARQGVQLGSIRLTGKLDLVDIDAKTKQIRVTDYKTGTAARDWKGKSEYEKVKLHKYHQQLMFYQLLIENSRDFAKYQFAGGTLQFVEPTDSGDIVALQNSYDDDELLEFQRLIRAVWHCIINLELPDVAGYSKNLKGILEFEHDLIDKYSNN